MTSKTDVPRLPRADARKAEGHRYSVEAINCEIAKNRRITPKEARLIHAVLRGRG